MEGNVNRQGQHGQLCLPRSWPTRSPSTRGGITRAAVSARIQASNIRPAGCSLLAARPVLLHLLELDGKSHPVPFSRGRSSSGIS